MQYPQTYTYQGRQSTIYSQEQTRCDGERCYKIECSGEPEAWFGDPGHAAACGVEYPTILAFWELTNGHWIAHYLPDTTDFPRFAAELDALGEW